MSTGHGWSSRFGFARWVAVMAVMPAFLGWIFLEAVIHGDPVSLSVILGFMAAGMVVVAIDTLARKGTIDQSKVDTGWERPDRVFSPWRLASKIYRGHRRTFPSAVRQTGAIGTDILNRRRKGRGRQGGHKRRGGSPAKKAADDGPGEPGEPPTLPTQLFLSFLDLALRWSCSSKTLRNQVAIGKLPRPVHLPVGPRFPVSVIQQIESGQWQSGTLEVKSDQTLITTKRRGRPRIAQPKSLVTSIHGGDQ